MFNIRFIVHYSIFIILSYIEIRPLSNFWFLDLKFYYNVRLLTIRQLYN